jgi:hypothetical protein
MGKDLGFSEPFDISFLYAQQLEAQPASSFVQDLTLLDAMTQSLPGTPTP